MTGYETAVTGSLCSPTDRRRSANDCRIPLVWVIGFPFFIVCMGLARACYDCLCVSFGPSDPLSYLIGKNQKHRRDSY
jgi:hypothetical protein